MAGGKPPDGALIDAEFTLNDALDIVNVWVGLGTYRPAPLKLPCTFDVVMAEIDADPLVIEYTLLKALGSLGFAFTTNPMAASVVVVGRNE
ncbi:MAG: hypothetical protein HW412_1547 [Bacteroidetes bacterium]|nr:hypothetical protein [Bacteroidota bacterium]